MNYPYQNQDKLENFNYGMELCRRFMRLNSFPMPKEIIFCEDPASNQPNGIYYPNSEQIIIYKRNCKKPVANPGFYWSFTGSKCDLTPAGILAHEMGHHIDKLLNSISLKVISVSKKYNNIKRELFAEYLGRFITNPDLVKRVMPNVYNIFAQKLCLIPAIVDDWRTVLQNAHEKIIRQNENFIKRINKNNRKYEND